MGLTRELITLHSLDGHSHDALLHHDERVTRVRARSTGRRTAQLHIHGIMGNFLVGTLRFLPAAYAGIGLPMLVPETRMGNVGQLFGHAIFEEALLDLDAAVRWLEEAGYDSLILSGYSSGATMAVRFAATRELPQLRAVVLYGAPWGLPQSHEQRCRRWESDPPYDDVLEMVRREVAADPDARLPDRMFAITQSRGPDRLPRHSEVYTWRTWWHTRGPNAVPAMGSLRRHAGLRNRHGDRAGHVGCRSRRRGRRRGLHRRARGRSDARAGALRDLDLPHLVVLARATGHRGYVV